ncbi:MAG: 50S ribosomal protein L30 [Bacteroidales bacterium]|nr:50S ribosomal protein L30 [Bacteroidales bacterium]
MSKIRVTQIKSKIGMPERQKKTLAALGLKKMHQSIEHEATPQVLGMVTAVKHLVRVEEI